MKYRRLCCKARRRELMHRDRREQKSGRKGQEDFKSCCTISLSLKERAEALKREVTVHAGFECRWFNIDHHET